VCSGSRRVLQAKQVHFTVPRRSQEDLTWFPGVLPWKGITNQILSSVTFPSSTSLLLLRALAVQCRRRELRLQLLPLERFLL